MVGAITHVCPIQERSLQGTLSARVSEPPPPKGGAWPGVRRVGGELRRKKAGPVAEG